MHENSRGRPQCCCTRPVRVRGCVDAIDLATALLVLLGAGAGLRQGEAFGLALDRIDATAGMITIDQQVVVVDRCPVLAPPKTSASLRDVPMPGFLMDAVTDPLASLNLGKNAGLCAPREGRFCAVTTTTARSGSLP